MKLMPLLLAGSGYDLKIRYSNMSDSTPNAEAIAEQELRYLEPQKKVAPGTGAGGVVQWGMDRFQHVGKHGRSHGKRRGHGKGKGVGKKKKGSSSGAWKGGFTASP